MSEQVKVEIHKSGGGLLFLEDKFTPAILGVLILPGRPSTVCYDLDKIIQILHDEGLSVSDANNYVNLRLLGVANGAECPGFVKLVKKKGDLDGAQFPTAED